MSADQSNSGKFGTRRFRMEKVTDWQTDTSTGLNIGTSWSSPGKGEDRIPKTTAVIHLKVNWMPGLAPIGLNSFIEATLGISSLSQTVYQVVHGVQKFMIQGGDPEGCSIQAQFYVRLLRESSFRLTSENGVRSDCSRPVRPEVSPWRTADPQARRVSVFPVLYRAMADEYI